MTSDPSERLAPHSREAEEAVLGAILLNNDAMIDLRFLNAESFYILRHSWIWQAMEKIQQRGEVIDNLTLMEELRHAKRLDDVGNSSYISHLINNTPTSLYAEVYGRIVERAAIRRKLLNAASLVANYSTSGEMDIEEVLTLSEKAVLSVTATERRQRGAWAFDVVSDVYDLVIAQMDNNEPVGGIPSGFKVIDDLTNGWQSSDLIVIAARPAMGKSALALNMAVNAAKRGVPVAFFSLEMGREQLIQRLIASETGINVSAIRTGRLEPEQLPLFMKATDTISRLPLFIDDDPTWNVVSLKAECRRLVASEGVGLIVVDYLQLLDGKKGGSNPENRVQEISFITRHLKVIAKELKVPLIALSQLSRDVERRADKRPVLSDLRESGSIEQDADVVAFIYRDDYYNDQSDAPNQAEIIFAKHRNGPTDTVKLHFNRTLTQFSDSRREVYHLPQYGTSKTAKTQSHYE